MIELIHLYLLSFSKMQNLVDTGYFEHDNKDGTSFEERSERFSLDRTAENLYHGNGCDMRHAIEQWETSKTHKKVMDDKYDMTIVVMYPDPAQEGYCYITMTRGDLY